MSKHHSALLCDGLPCPLLAPAEDPSYYTVGGAGVAVFQDIARTVDSGHELFTTLELSSHSLDVVVAHYRGRRLLWYDSGKKVGKSAHGGCVVVDGGCVVVDGGCVLVDGGCVLVNRGSVLQCMMDESVCVSCCGVGLTGRASTQ